MSIYDLRFDRAAERDLHQMGPGPERERVQDAIRHLADGHPSADVTAVKGAPGWLRFRVGPYRVLHYYVPPDRKIITVGRVVHRSELKRATAGLPEI